MPACAASSSPRPTPTRKVNGKGVARLRRAGVEVVTGVLKEEADKLNRPFFKAVSTGLPYVTLKAAVTLDGKLATATGDSRWVTGEPARAWVHRLRDQVDVILVGATTVQQDNPQLTTRLAEGGGKDPVRVVVDSHLRLSPKLTVFTQRSPARTVVATLEDPAGRKAKRFAAVGAEVWQLPGEAGARGPRGADAPPREGGPQPRAGGGWGGDVRLVPARGAWRTSCCSSSPPSSSAARASPGRARWA